MSVKKTRSLNAGAGKSLRRASFGRFFSCKAIHLEEGKTLKEMDSKSIKTEIRRWARAVAAYARQVSSRFASPRG